MADCEVWHGDRPLTPDGLPLVGKLAPGLYINAGHGFNGWRDAGITAQARGGACCWRRGRRARLRRGVGAGSVFKLVVPYLLALVRWSRDGVVFHFFFFLA